jgi:hypothetical protein
MADTTKEFINASTVETVYGLCIKMQEQAYKGNESERRIAESFAQRGMRAVRSRDRLTLITLEKATEIMLQLSNDQFGEYRYREDIPESHRIEPTEVQMWREAYKMADQGTPLENFKWIYGAAVKLAHGM